MMSELAVLNVKKYSCAKSVIAMVNSDLLFLFMNGSFSHLVE